MNNVACDLKLLFTVHSGQKSLEAAALIGISQSIISSQGVTFHGKRGPLHDLLMQFQAMADKS